MAKALARTMLSFYSTGTSGRRRNAPSLLADSVASQRAVLTSTGVTTHLKP
jgi:hypothetical protein